MTLNQIIGNRKTESKIDTDLWKKINEKYSEIENTRKEETIPIKTEEKIEPKLRYEDGVPKLELKILENTAVHTPTQKEYDNLMQIYDAGNWQWELNTSIECNYFYRDNAETCLTAGKSYYKKIEKKIAVSPKEFYTKRNWKIISLEEFCTIEKITQKIIKQLNEYYDKNYPNRESKER
jgi:hypothetical protein